VDFLGYQPTRSRTTMMTVVRLPLSPPLGLFAHFFPSW